jgi:hypothetical protein
MFATMSEVPAMPVPGRKPKVGPVRHRHAPTYDTTEVPNTPFTGGPSLPRQRHRPLVGEPPEPPRPLRSSGRALWDRTWRSAGADFDAPDRLLLLAEQTDERTDLRALGSDDWRVRVALRQLDAQLLPGVTALEREVALRFPRRWPSATRRWWAAVSTLPHAVLWNDADWAFALDTAALVAALHEGDRAVAKEVRAREAILGVTADARRALRIRYTDDTGPTVEDSPNVRAMAAYKAMVAGDGAN